MSQKIYWRIQLLTFLHLKSFPYVVVLKGNNNNNNCKILKPFSGKRVGELSGNVKSCWGFRFLAFGGATNTTSFSDWRYFVKGIRPWRRRRVKFHTDPTTIWEPQMIPICMLFLQKRNTRNNTHTNNKKKTTTPRRRRQPRQQQQQQQQQPQTPSWAFLKAVCVFTPPGVFFRDFDLDVMQLGGDVTWLEPADVRYVMQYVTRMPLQHRVVWVFKRFLLCFFWGEVTLVILHYYIAIISFEVKLWLKLYCLNTNSTCMLAYSVVFVGGKRFIVHTIHSWEYLPMFLGITHDL